MKRIFLDYASTTPTDPRVLEAMKPYFTEEFGNPSSPHVFGQSARKAVEEAREVVAAAIHARPEEIVFTSGGSEANNHAIFGVAHALKGKGNHIIVSKIEHHSVIRPVEELASSGFNITWIEPEGYGRIPVHAIEKAITPQTILIVVMHASNEIGTIHPVEKIGQVARERGICFLVDAIQTVGHVPVDVASIHCDLLSMSAHKFYGPKGVGALYVRRGTKINSFILGGDQERGRRASTQNVPGIVGAARALQICNESMSAEAETQTALRHKMHLFIVNNIQGYYFNGHPTLRLPNNLHCSFEGVDGESLLMNLDMKGFCASMGSACTSGQLTPSHVLKAIGLSDALALGSLRISIGRWTTPEDIDAFLPQLQESVELLRNKR